MSEEITKSSDTEIQIANKTTISLSDLKLKRSSIESRIEKLPEVMSIRKQLAQIDNQIQQAINLGIQ